MLHRIRQQPEEKDRERGREKDSGVSGTLTVSQSVSREAWACSQSG